MIRKAQKDDLQQIIPLLIVIFEDMELDALETLGPEMVQSLVYEAAKYPDYRYFYDRALVYEENDEILGVAYSYSESEEDHLDNRWYDILKQHNLPACPLFIDKESFSGEWYLESLVVHPAVRGQGIGTQLITATEQVAKEQGIKYISLNVDQGNPKAEALYRRLGFKKKTELILSNHCYNHLIKPVD